ncbi:MAG TPA: protein translocase subunit SecF [Candidatus Azoamicus sp.]
MNIDFIKKKYIYLTISIILCITSILIVIKKNITLGLEFCSGTEIEIQLTKEIKIEELKIALSKIKNTKINYYGSNKNIQIKTKNTQNKVEEIKNILKTISCAQHIKIINSTYIGSEISKETLQKSLSAVIIALISMTLYLIIRFNVVFAFSAIITLIHDIVILIGIISLAEIELDLIIISALFTAFGYSMNDSIIIFDRIRENIKFNKNDTKLPEIINNSINKTLSRTISTSLSTVFVTIILMFFAGESLFLFSLILTLGIIIGTYSSIYISAIPLTFFKKI